MVTVAGRNKKKIPELGSADKILFKYIDDEHEKVTVSSDGALEFAIAVMKKTKLISVFSYSI